MIKLVVAIRLVKASKREYKTSHLRMQRVTTQNKSRHISKNKDSQLRTKGVTSHNTRSHSSEDQNLIFTCVRRNVIVRKVGGKRKVLTPTNIIYCSLFPAVLNH
jgi:hypothetical protein